MKNQRDVHTHIVVALLAILLFCVSCQEPDAGVANTQSTSQSTRRTEASTESKSHSFRDRLTGFNWEPKTLPHGIARVSCDYDYNKKTAGKELTDISFGALLKYFYECKKSNTVHIYWNGEINSNFAELMERVSELSVRFEIPVRILEIESGGGDVQEAMRAGEAIGASEWGIWTKRHCYSACVLILAAGDMRSISGDVGIHRIFPSKSTAKTRDELSAALEQIHSEMVAYLRKNGTSTILADEMMAVSSNEVRILTPEELKNFGLDGSNAAQSDVARLKLIQKCGAEFVRKREEMFSVIERECRYELAPGNNLAEKEPWLLDCYFSVRDRYDFPDPICPDETPLRHLEFKRQ